jgi:hypothetical protein
MAERVAARHDPDLTATIVRRTPLYYRDRAGSGSERPAFVRAGSSLALVADGIAVLQDNANYLALIDRTNVDAVAVELPPGPGGHRVFDKDHEDSDHKLDLEACATLPGENLLVAFGSGSKPTREWVITVDWRDNDPPATVLYEAHVLFERLRQETAFAGSELNVEGAVFVDARRIRLFQRGNGEPRGDLQPVDATADLDWAALLAHLEQPDQVEPPPLQNIVQYQLGELDAVRLTLNDVILFSASAEASGDAKHDGRIAGSVLGVIDDQGARWTHLVFAGGEPLEAKLEGLTLVADNPYHVFFVTDGDDDDTPSELFEADLTGPWYRAADAGQERRDSAQHGRRMD